MKIEAIDVSAIEIGDRLRGLDPDWAAMVAESMRDRGLDTPILVREADEAGSFLLVAGLHRLAAAKQLGWPTIMARVMAATDAEARLAEIDENLMRRELSELDRATFLAERQAIWQAMHPHTAKRGRKKGQSGSISDGLAERFSKAAARKLGVHPRSIDKAIARFKMLLPDVRARLGAHPVADKAAQIDLLAGCRAPDQRRIADALLRDLKPVRSVAEAMAELGLPLPFRAAALPDDDRAVERLKDLWFAASPEARRRFLVEIGATVVSP